MKALYDLSRKIASFDFFCWMVMQEGATEIVFDTRAPRSKRWPPEVNMRRFESILWPGPPLLGLKASIGTKGAQLGPYMQVELANLVRSGWKMPRLKSVLPPANEKYTVTLRRDSRLPLRNSDEPMWRGFASEIGARVIEDYEVEPIELHERMALYAGAEQNFFVTNGPVILCMLSEYPCMAFDVANGPPKRVVAWGESYPWLLPDRHFQIWEPCTLPVIRKHFDRWRKSRWV